MITASLITEIRYKKVRKKRGNNKSAGGTCLTDVARSMSRVERCLEERLPQIRSIEDRKIANERKEGCGAITSQLERFYLFARDLVSKQNVAASRPISPVVESAQGKQITALSRAPTAVSRLKIFDEGSRVRAMCDTIASILKQRRFGTPGARFIST